jgi:hypothetical protein
MSSCSGSDFSGCGPQLWSRCAGAYADPQTLQPRSLLLNPQSMCFMWREWVQIADLGADSQSQDSTYLDQAMLAYCSGAGSNTQECECIAFPTIAKDWCASQSDLCPAPPTVCSVKQFVQQTSQTMETVQFSSCAPHSCWFAPCRLSPDVQLQTFAQRQTLEHCPALCVQVASVSTVSVPTTNPLSSSTFNINETLIAQCGSNGDAPAQMTVPPATFGFPLNSPYETQVTVANSGDFPVLWAAEVSAPWLSVPSSGFIGQRASTVIAVGIDQTTFGVGQVGQTYSASATFSYQDGVGNAVSTPVSFSFQILDAVPPIVEVQYSVPPTLILLMLFLVLVGLALWATTKDATERKYARSRLPAKRTR